MKAICYKNTKTNLPGWVDNVHVEQKYGYAYETPTHYVHFYGKESFYIISVGLTVIEGKAKYKSLEDWVKYRFGADEIQVMTRDVGHVLEGIWRPSLYYWYDTCNALRINESEQVSQEQSIRLLVQKLDELLIYIEPSIEGLECYSYKTRELLILSCTEVENQWRSILVHNKITPINGKDYTTKDYAKLINKIFLTDFSIRLRNNSFRTKITPFLLWNVSNPTKSLVWYDAYNKTKHDRYNSFSDAKLKFIIEAIAANIVLYAIRYSPLSLINNSTVFSATINQMFTIEMENVDIKSFYIPELDTSKIMTDDCIVFDSYRDKLNKEWKVDNILF
ncbi:MAG: hypothetical protein J6I53_07170 [Treponema sp.]|nr:hypothetical protein [Treponema sp.]